MVIEFICDLVFRSTKRFGKDGERFEHLAFLNLAQNVVCLIWSYISKILFHISTDTDLGLGIDTLTLVIICENDKILNVIACVG